MLSEKYKEKGTDLLKENKGTDLLKENKGTDLLKEIGSFIPLIKGLFWGAISWMVSLFRLKKSSSLIYVFQLK
jgi:hypothetical protein